MAGGFRLTWKGDKVLDEVLKDVVSPALSDIALDVEGEAKEELQAGHGVETGTLRRSIHAASPDYTWAKDNVKPSPGTPERGGQAAEPKKQNGQLLISVGSGLNYALAVHQGHGKFSGYHYLTNGLNKVKPRVPQHIARHKKG